MEPARSSTGDITDGSGGGGALLVRSYSAGSSSGINHQPEPEQEQSEERLRESSWGRVARLRRRAAEQRARFYIVRRCLHMLLCWRDDTKL